MLQLFKLSELASTYLKTIETESKKEEQLITK